jgi:hypothetical protein
MARSRHGAAAEIPVRHLPDCTSAGLVSRANSIERVRR